MKIEKVNINDLQINPNNPRVISQFRLLDLMKSIRENPEFLELNPIVARRSDGIVLGGNMRLTACKELGLKEVPVVYTDLSPEKEKIFLIVDNVGYGEWDVVELAAILGQMELEEVDISLTGLTPEAIQDVIDKTKMPDPDDELQEVEFCDKCGQVLQLKSNGTLPKN